MSTYRMLRFDSVMLPDRMTEEDFGTGAVESTLLDSVGGTFDYFGNRPRLPRRIPITHTGRYLGEPVLWIDGAGNHLTSDGTVPLAFDVTTSPRDQVDALKALTGQRLPLWRQRVSDDALQWRMARLMSVEYTRKPADVGRVADIVAQWETDEPTWKAETIVVASTAVTAGTPATLIPNNLGGVAITNAVLRITRTSGTVTALALANHTTGALLYWTGSLSGGGVLVIDTGLQTVRRNGVDAYSGFSLASTHTARSWFPLDPGANICTFEAIGGNVTVAVEFFDQWI